MIPLSSKGKESNSLSLKTSNEYQKSYLQLLCRNFPKSPRKGRTPSLRDPRFRDRPSLLGHDDGKNYIIGCEDAAPKIHEQQQTADLHSVRSSPLSVEDGVEVDQDSGTPSIYSRNPVSAPLEIPTLNMKGTRKVFCEGSASASVTNTCQNVGHLPDTNSLLKRLEKKLEIEGFKISVNFANLSNNALDIYLRILIKACLDLVVPKSVDKFSGPIQPGLNGLPTSRYVQNQTGSVFASISDFWAAIELNPVIIGDDWPLPFEKVCLRASEK